MKTHRLETDVWVPAPIDAVWNFFTDPNNLKRLTPDRMNPDLEVRENGRQVIVRVSPLPPLPFRAHWVSELKDFVTEGPKRRFTDVQASGPFAYWKHDHIFEEGDGDFAGGRSNSKLQMHEKGTWIRDRVEYALPAGPLGELAHKIRVRRELENLFVYRREVLRKIFP